PQPLPIRSSHPPCAPLSTRGRARRATPLRASRRRGPPDRCAASRRGGAAQPRVVRWLVDTPFRYSRVSSNHVIPLSLARQLNEPPVRNDRVDWTLQDARPRPSPLVDASVHPIRSLSVPFRH